MVEGLWIVTGVGEPTLVADGLLTSIFDGDIRHRHISGTAAPSQKFHRNIVESRIENIDFTKIDFARCDWKDCRIERAVFVDCDLGQASMITNAFSECKFVQCRFSDTGVSDCSFVACEFTDCDLTSIIMKASRLERCGFYHCTTSNRIIESSILLRTEWKGMELALALVTGNFGLRSTELSDCRVVSRIGSEDLVSRSTSLAMDDLNAIERFRISYFWTGVIDGDPAELEAALDLRNWTKDAVVQASFAAQLSSFSQFLMALFNLSEAPIYPIIILHSRNFTLLEWLSSHDDLLPIYQVVAGIHLTLTREIDAFVAQLSTLIARLSDVRPIHFAAEGPVDAGYFERWFIKLGIAGVQVVSVQPRNSPVDLAAVFTDSSSYLAVFALFLACRTKVELMKIANATEHDKTSPISVSKSLIAFSSGFSKASPAEYEINVQTILPRSLLLDLHLSVSVAMFKQARGVLVGLLMPGTNDAAPPNAPTPKAARSRRRSPRA